MIKTLSWVILITAFLAGTSAWAQDLCPVGKASNKLVCLIPGIFGVNGLQLNTGSHQGHFEDSFVGTLRPLDSAIASQSSVLPLASPSSGITFTWNPSAKVFTPSTESFGPVLGERAETIGRYKLSLGVAYQFFKFSTVDGTKMTGLPVVFTHQDDSDDVFGRTCSVTGDNTTQCGFVRDVIKTNTAVDLKIHQYTTYVTFGLTNKIDVSMAIPIENARMGVSTTATIVNNSQQNLHTFVPRSDCAAPCFNGSFSKFRTASGIGDITLRVKGTAWSSERSALALGVDMRVPSGDELNFLGSGALGLKPIVVWSYRSRISPHALVGFEMNRGSVLAGDISTGVKTKLPGQLTYSLGADAWLTNRVTVAVDLIGQQIFEAPRETLATFTELGACTTSACTSFAAPKTDSNLDQAFGSYNISNGSIGVKLKPFENFLVTGNALVKLNNGGLRARVVPLLAFSYTF